MTNFSDYALAGRLFTEQFFKIFIAKYSWAAFLGGPIGVFLSYVLSIPLGLMLKEGVIKLDFAIIDWKVYQDANNYKNVIDRLQSLNDKPPLTKEEKAKIVAEVKAATKGFISFKKYLK